MKKYINLKLTEEKFCKTNKIFIPNILKKFKGISARKLFLKHPEIKNKLWNGYLWNPSYFVATVSENTDEQIKKYIQTQKER